MVKQSFLKHFQPIVSKIASLLKALINTVYTGGTCWSKVNSQIITDDVSHVVACAQGSLFVFYQNQYKINQVVDDASDIIDHMLLIK
jgi:hypothetical protein